MIFNEPSSLGLISNSSHGRGRPLCSVAGHRYVTGRLGVCRTLKTSPVSSSATSTISSTPHFAISTLSWVQSPCKAALTAAAFRVEHHTLVFGVCRFLVGRCGDLKNLRVLAKAPEAICLRRPLIALHHVSVNQRTKDSNETRAAYVWLEKVLNLAWLATNRFHKPDGGSIAVIEKIEPTASYNRPHGPTENLSEPEKAVDAANSKFNVGKSVVSLTGVRPHPVAIPSEKKLAILKTSMARPSQAPVPVSLQRTIRLMESIIGVGSSRRVTGRGGARCLRSSFCRPCRKIQQRRRSVHDAKAWR